MTNRQVIFLYHVGGSHPHHEGPEIMRGEVEPVATHEYLYAMVRDAKADTDRSIEAIVIKPAGVLFG